MSWLQSRPAPGSREANQPRSPVQGVVMKRPWRRCRGRRWGGLQLQGGASKVASWGRACELSPGGRALKKPKALQAAAQGLVTG